MEREKIFQVLHEAKKIIFGQDQLLESIMAALVCEGHLLIEGMPGLGKTLSVNVMSKLCHLQFKRIQFTPDLLPSDLIGTMIFNQKVEEFKTKLGPIFTQILLADEINRAPAKVQSALLEAMAEKQVTIGENSHRLNFPFVVLATQNPLDQEGTYALPEAQLDRFMLKIKIDYPDFNSEKKILETETDKINQPFFLSTQDLMVLKEQIEKVYVDDKIKDLIVKIVQASRPSHPSFPQKFQGIILVGASPRASLWLYKLGRYRAYLEGKNFVTPEHVMFYAPMILEHRLLLSYEAQQSQLPISQIVMQLMQLFI